MDRPQEAIAWERRWAVPVAVATFSAVALLVVSNFVSPISGSGEAEVLRSIHDHQGSVVLGGLLQAAGFLLLVGPLFYLFRAVRARSERVRPQLVGLVVVAPMFLAVSSGLTIGARDEAASQFVAGDARSTLSAQEAKEKCVSDRKDEGAESFTEEFEPAPGEAPLAACEKRKTEDDEAENALTDSSLAPIVSGLGLAGGLGFAVALLYSGLWALRLGLLTRFWASLGMASGVAFLLGPLFFITLIWFVYFGLLVIGKVPAGRPPAWAAGEAVPWPTPGERAAAELDPSETSETSEPANSDGSSNSESERRKRKQRD